jgi:hypothetical protein
MPHGLFQLVIPAISLGSVSCCDTYTALVDPAAPGVDSSAVEGKTAAVAAAAVTFPNVEVDGSDRVFGRTPAATVTMTMETKKKHFHFLSAADPPSFGQDINNP